MRLNFFSLLTALFCAITTVNAAGTWVGVLNRSVTQNGHSYFYVSTRISRNGGPEQYAKVSFNDGCKNNPIPEWKSMCIDRSKDRGHFVTSAGNKYCFKGGITNRCSDCDGLSGCFCTWFKYYETKCTW